MDPVLRLRRPVTPFGVGTVLGGTVIGGGLEIVDSGCSAILWVVAGEGGNGRDRRTACWVSSREERECAKATEGNRTLTRAGNLKPVPQSTPLYLFTHVIISLYLRFVVQVRKTLMAATPHLTSSQTFNPILPTITTLILIRDTHYNLPPVPVSTQSSWLSLSLRSTQVRLSVSKIRCRLVAEPPCSPPVIPLLLAVLIRVVYTKASRTTPMSYNVKWGREKSVQHAFFIRSSS